MSDFFSELSAAAKRTFNSVSNEVTIAAEEQRIRETYQALGRLYFRAKRNGKLPDGPEFTDCCKRINSSLRRINELKRANNVSEVYADEEDFADVK